MMWWPFYYRKIESDIYYLCFLGQAHQLEKIYKSNIGLVIGSDINHLN